MRIAGVCSQTLLFASVRVGWYRGKLRSPRVSFVTSTVVSAAAFDPSVPCEPYPPKSIPNSVLQKEHVAITFGTHPSSTAIRRIPSACCARAASGQATATLPRTVMNSRHRIQLSPRLKTAQTLAHWKGSIVSQAQLVERRVNVTLGLGCVKTQRRARATE